MLLSKTGIPDLFVSNLLSITIPVIPFARVRPTYNLHLELFDSIRLKSLLTIAAFISLVGYNNTFSKVNPLLKPKFILFKP